MHNSTRNSLKKALSAYKGEHELQALSEVFIEFLDDKIANGWIYKDVVILGEVIRQFGTELFCSVPLEERIPYYIHTYEDMFVRATLLLNSRGKVICLPVALFRFQNDDSETVQEIALEALAYAGWRDAEKEAIKFWNTKKTMRRITALNCLKGCKSPQLSKYIEKGMKSKDMSVKLIAESLHTLEQHMLQHPELQNSISTAELKSACDAEVEKKLQGLRLLAYDDLLTKESVTTEDLEVGQHKLQTTIAIEAIESKVRVVVEIIKFKGDLSKVISSNGFFRNVDDTIKDLTESDH